MSAEESAGGHSSGIDPALLTCWRKLGIDAQRVTARRLPLFEEPPELVLAETGTDGREHRLSPPAAAAWAALRAAAAAESVELHIVSAHRSIARQIEIIERKLAAGQPIGQILAVSAPPGCSEHHTGRAIDIGTPRCRALEPEFEHTAAFRWLAEHAGGFGFRLSYPPHNPWGYDYEPWHWCFHAAPERAQE